MFVVACCFQSMKAPDLRERLQESEKLMKEMSKTWEEKLKETERIHLVCFSINWLYTLTSNKSLTSNLIVWKVRVFGSSLQSLTIFYYHSQSFSDLFCWLCFCTSTGNTKHGKKKCTNSWGFTIPFPTKNLILDIAGLDMFKNYLLNIERFQNFIDFMMIISKSMLKLLQIFGRTQQKMY